MTEPEGIVGPGLQPLREAFAAVLEEQPGTGAALAIWHDGRWVADLWGGAADAAHTRGWQPTSIVMPYSVSKAFVAVSALLLVQRGQLELDVPVQRYWPQLSAPVTMRQLLSHQAGLVALGRPAQTDLLYDWQGLCDVLAGTAPAWEPGTAIGESALFYGHLVGEVVRRVDGRAPGAFLRDEVTGPLDLDFAFGLAESDMARVVDLTGLEEPFRAATCEGRPRLFAEALLNPPGALDAAVVNSTKFRAAEIPAINGHGTARAVAGLYAALLQGLLLDPAVRDEATRVQARGVDRVLGGGERSWGLGFVVDDDGFGMGGTGGSSGWASVAGGYAFGFVTGSMGTHDRADRLESVLRDCVGLPAL